jgi:hypothetical protein
MPATDFKNPALRLGPAVQPLDNFELLKAARMPILCSSA